VPSNEDLLFGKIALAQKFCTPAQIDECSRMQALEPEPPPLGELLLYKGYLTPQQHARVLEIQKQNLGAIDPVLKKRREAILFGKLAVREKLVTEDQANECLRLQAKEGESRSLGEILIARRYLTAQQVKDLLAKQQKRIMECPSCRLSFTVLTLSEGKKVDCPRCGGQLKEGKAASTSTDAEFSTQMLKAVKTSAPPGVRRDSRKIPAVPRVVKVACVICDKKFDGAVDSTGRVRCPDCHTSFTPR
jgi:DNA-directed RNA polymerase subunit RPC12/RpoP